MKLNIIGYKNLSNNELENEITILQEAENILPYDNDVKEAIKELVWQLHRELDKRSRSKKVWVEFSCSWSGYSNNPSAPRRDIGLEYRKLDRNMVESFGNFYSHRFSDGTTNDWHICIVDVKPKSYKRTTYPHQIDEFLKESLEELKREK